MGPGYGPTYDTGLVRFTSLTSDAEQTPATCHIRRSGLDLDRHGDKPGDRMMAVTIDNLPGYEIKEIFGETLGTIARTQNVHTEGIKIPSGATSPKLPQMLAKWRRDATARMVEEAYERAANAVAGVRFDHRAIGAGWTEICANGSAVFIVPARP
jgi:uncharacterized protein YbjQ (UPF0145 family)